MRGTGWGVGRFLAAAAAVLALAAPGLAAVKPTDVAVRFLPAAKASLYLRFQNKELRMASSRRGLDKAQPVRSGQLDSQTFPEGEYYLRYSFSKTGLPVAVSGLSKVQGRFDLTRVQTIRDRSGPLQPSSVSGELFLTTRARSGRTWTYVLSVSAERVGSKSEPLVIKAPKVNPKDLKLEITTKVEGRDARVGLTVKSGGASISNILKNGKNAPARIRIVSAKGETVVNESGDLQKFGFT